MGWGVFLKLINFFFLGAMIIVVEAMMRNLTSELRFGVESQRRNKWNSKQPLFVNPLSKENHGGGGVGSHPDTRGLCCALRNKSWKETIELIVCWVALFLSCTHPQLPRVISH